ncbi:hypothetical protein [Streptomyces gibsoniae]|uniref:ATP-grasp domain-containing protein n=1 Tax=Streptomyces gibsoniae TaxID=3075529 RepID=A0ABU2TZH3_9ACTN|nr:hypothetical protein [Streptomyces sp. DSM 41699]MDT0466369.1 hypothetical protein [Streptomyces sp. DSM 41699]
MSTPPPHRRILIAGPTAALVRAAGAAGFRVWSLCDACRCPPEELAALSERVLVADFGDEIALKEALDAAAESGLYVNPPAAVRLLADPEAVRRLVHDNQLCPPEAAQDAAGDRYRVDTLSVHGMHHTVGITAETPYGLLHPAPLAGDTAATLRSVVTSLLDLAGYQYGPAHTEVVLTADGPVTTGCAAVVADEPVPWLVRVASGRELVTDAFAVLAGQDAAPVRARRFAASVTLPEIRPDEVRALPYVRHVVASDGERGGQVVLEAESPEHAVELVSRIKRLFD